MTPSSTPRTDALREKIRQNSTPNERGCWIWDLAINSRGYGNIWDGERLTVAHRLSYEVFHGPIPAGQYVCHKCDVRACVNPDHLWAGAPAENLSDCYQKRRRESLDAAQIAQLKTWIGEGLTQREAGGRLGITHAAVYYYQKRGWK